MTRNNLINNIISIVLIAMLLQYANFREKDHWFSFFLIRIDKDLFRGFNVYSYVWYLCNEHDIQFYSDKCNNYYNESYYFAK